MEVILKDNVVPLGKIGQIVQVSDGYARNYLLPRRLAVAATAGNRRIALAQAKAIEARQATLKGEAEALKQKLEADLLIFVRQAGEEGKLFGSVTTKDIADRLVEIGCAIDKRKIVLGQPLKTLGRQSVAVWLHPEVTATLTVDITQQS